MEKMKKKKEISIVRSSAAEYLTFITATGESDVNAVYFDENVWLTQKMMGILYNVETHTVNYHLKKIFNDGELDENSVIRKFRITAYRREGFIKKLQIFMQRVSTMILKPNQPDCFLRRFRISCIGQFMGKPQLK